MEPGPRESIWRRRGRQVLFWGIVIELVGVAAFVAMLLLGERTRLSVIALYAPRQPMLVLAVLSVLAAPLTKRRVRVLVAVTVLASLVVLFPVMGFRVGSSRSSELPVRLATYNVYFGWLGETAIFEEIAAFSADIVVVQAGYATLGDRLKARFPTRFVHQFEEFVLVTRYKVLNVDVPPPLADGKPPMYVAYLLETEAGPLRLFNVHPYSPRRALFDDDRTADNIRRREEQVAAVTAAVKRESSPFVIAGDTNLPVLSSVDRRYFGGFHDAFDDVGFGFGWTFPAKHPWMRIDRALAGPGIRFVDVRVGKRGVSDHLPLFVDFELESHL